MLAETLRKELPSLVFLSEIQAYQSDILSLSRYFEDEYCLSHNSEDITDPELPMIKSKAKGGTMVLWRKWLDPHVKVISVNTASFLPVVLTIPGSRPSLHVSLYLPTHGQDTEFVSELTNLRNSLEDLCQEYDQPSIYIRGDANVNKKNIKRVDIFESFKNHFNLVQVDIEHKTYHHFVGEGRFDSNVDVILHTRAHPLLEVAPEHVAAILCQKINPAIHSHHDILLTEFTLPLGGAEPSNEQHIPAPRLDIQRSKITWSDEGIEEYSSLVGNHLERIRNRWLVPNSQVCMSILLNLTNTVMSQAAIFTNEHTLITKKTSKPRKKIPKMILRTKKRLNKAHRMMISTGSEVARNKFKICKKEYHHTVRLHNLQGDIEQDSMLYNIMGENPNKVFRSIKSLRNTKNSSIAKLTVGQTTYHGSEVADGFFHSMSALKKCDLESLKAAPELAEKLLDYDLVIALCQRHEEGIPPMDLRTSTKLLNSMRKNVRDHYSITSQHYLNAGQEGLRHFNLLLNGIIADINNAGLEELNTAHGLIYYKGHHKDKTSDRSYRNISTCPVLAKAVDMYLRDLYGKLWHKQEAETQYQGTGSSHELASLLLTEVIQYTQYVTQKPLYLLALDAQSAFDRCLRQVLISELHKANIPPAAILMIDKRLANRHTMYEWEGEVMGPAADVTGFEQGGVNSSDYYKLYNNEQLKTAQESQLGVDIGSGVISAVGQADDVVLGATSLYNLQLLVNLTEQYCRKYRVQLEPSKTKLLAYCPPSLSFLVDHAMNCHQITLNNVPISLGVEAEHVGVLRSTSGNLPHILNRIAMHKKSLHALLPTGMARRRRGNPAASVKLSQMYGVPVLLSGVTSLVLSKSELKMLEGHYIRTLQGLLRLHDKTPRSIVCFLAGSLPITAILHQRMLSLMLMISFLSKDPLYQHARYVLLHPVQCCRSWFIQAKNICQLYGLPHPLQVLENPPAKQPFKSLVKKKIACYWKELLSTEALQLSSLQYFNPRVHSLTSPHPLWLTAGSSSHEVNKATVLAKMISGRYRTEKLCRFWSGNHQGHCLASTCHQIPGDLVHLLLHCPALAIARKNLQEMWLLKSAQYPPLHTFIIRVLEGTDKLKMLFILDPTAIPEVDHLIVLYGMPVLGTIFYMARTYAYGLHRKKLIILGRWPYATNNENCSFKINQINSDSFAGRDDMTKTVEYEPLVTACVGTKQRVKVATMTRDQHTLAISLTGDDDPPGENLLQDPAIHAVGGRDIYYIHSDIAQPVQVCEHNHDSVAQGDQTRKFQFQAEHVQPVLGVTAISPGVCDNVPSAGVGSVTTGLDKQCSMGTMPYSLREGEQLRYLGRAGGALVGSSQFSPRHIAGNLPRNRQDSVNSLEP